MSLLRFAVARTVKVTSPETVIVMGGAHPTILPFEVLAEDAVDYVVVGDGERTMAELVSALADGGPDLADIPGLDTRRPSRT